MEGKVKFYSTERGFGYLLDDEGNDYFFSVRDLKKFDAPPKMGDLALFEVHPRKDKTSLKAVEVRITAIQKQEREDSRIKCPWCGTKMTPRLVFTRTIWGMKVNSAFCPYCGGELDHGEE